MMSKAKPAILYFDDELENLEGFMYAFRKYFQVFATTRIDEADQILEQNEIKVIVCDQKMPEVTGVDYLNKVQQAYPGVIRIMLTAYADTTIMMDAINKGGIYRYIKKPWEKEEMLHVLNMAVEKYDLKAQNSKLLHDLKILNELQVEANKRLREEDARIHNILSSISDPICMVDKTFKIVWINNEYSKVFGGNVIGRKCYEIQNRKNVKCDGCLVKNTFKNGQREYFNNTVYDKFDNERQCLVSTSVSEFDHKGKPKHVIEILRDLTDQMNLYQMALESENKYRMLYEKAPLAYQSLDINGHILDVNPRWMEILGYDREKVIGTWFGDYLPEESRAGFKEKFKEFKKNKKISGARFRLRTKSGDYILVEFEGACSGEPVEGDFKTYCVFQDITEQEQSFLKVKESEEKYKSLFENMTSGFALHEMVYDKKGQPVDYKFVEINKAFEKLTGMKKGQLIGKSVMQVLPRTEKYWIKNYGKVARTGKPMSFENYSVEFDKYYQVLAYSPEKEHFATIFSDITHTRKSQKAIKEWERRFREIHENVKLISVMLDTKGKITFANEYACKLLKVKPSEVIGMDWFRHFIPRGHEIKKVFKENILNGSIPANYDNPVVNTKGEIRHISWNNTILRSEDGIVIGTASLGEDITIKKEMDRRILNAQIEAEERERKRFAEDLHDELGPFLAGIKLYINELGMDNVNAAERGEMAEHLKQLVDEAVDKTRSISNSLIPNVLIDYGIVKALRSFTSKIRDTKYINVQFEAPEKPIVIDKNIEVILYRVVIELINNTIKHARARNIDIQLGLSGKNLTVDYQDDGIGFDLEKALKRRKGLGVQNIISRINTIHGKYSFESEKNKGMRITMEIDL